MTEVIFEVREDDIDGGYTAAALGYGIQTEGETMDELRANVKEAVDVYFDEASITRWCRVMIQSKLELCQES